MIVADAGSEIPPAFRPFATFEEMNLSEDEERPHPVRDFKGFVNYVTEQIHDNLLGIKDLMRELEHGIDLKLGKRDATTDTEELEQ